VSERIPAWSLSAEAAVSIAIPTGWPERVTREWALEGATGNGVETADEVIAAKLDSFDPAIAKL
jgi:hypothetical protein